MVLHMLSQHSEAKGGGKGFKESLNCVARHSQNQSKKEAEGEQAASYPLG